MTRTRKVSVGDVAPDFTLPDQSGTPVRLGDLVGEKTVVLYFYPKDETPGCTIEARAFRDSYEQFSAKDAQVVGVSSDSVGSRSCCSRMPTGRYGGCTGWRRRWGSCRAGSPT